MMELFSARAQAALFHESNETGVVFLAQTNRLPTRIRHFHSLKQLADIINHFQPQNTIPLIADDKALANTHLPNWFDSELPLIVPMTLFSQKQQRQGDWKSRKKR